MAFGDPYATAEDLEAYLRIGDADDTTHMDLAVESASSWVTTYCERDFNQTTTASARTFMHTAGDVIWVDDFHTTTDLVLATDEELDGTFGTTWLTTEYQPAPLNGSLSGEAGWPYTHLRAISYRSFPAYRDRSLVRVTAQWGWPAVPSAVKKATLIMAARLYKRRDSPEGVLGGFEGFGAVRVGTRLDPDVEMLLAPFRKFPVAVG